MAAGLWMSSARGGQAMVTMHDSAPIKDVPAGANAECPGVKSENAGKSSACENCPNQGRCSSGEARGKGPDDDLIDSRMDNIKHKLLVLSGKGGVGKSTVASYIARRLSALGYKVGLLDIDICGPSVPKMLGVEGFDVRRSNFGWEPVYVDENLSVMSVGFLLQGQDDAVVWRGPRKDALIRQFLSQVNWGELDFLVIDTPPGTSDEHISMTQHLERTSVDGAVIVSTPQDVALADVRKEIGFCRKVAIKILGVVENMRGLTAMLPCGNANFRDRIIDLESREDVSESVSKLLSAAFPGKKLAMHINMLPDTGGGVKKMAKDLGVDYLGAVAFDPSLAVACDRGWKTSRGPLEISAAENDLDTMVQTVLQKIGAESPATRRCPEKDAKR